MGVWLLPAGRGNVRPCLVNGRSCLGTQVSVSVGRVRAAGAWSPLKRIRPVVGPRRLFEEPSVRTGSGQASRRLVTVRWLIRRPVQPGPGGETAIISDVKTMSG